MVAQNDLSATLDEDLIDTVDHDLRDFRVSKEHFDRTEPESLVQNFFDQALALLATPVVLRFLVEQAHDLHFGLCPQFRFLFGIFRQLQIGFLEVNLVDEPTVDPNLEISFLVVGVHVRG